MKSIIIACCLVFFLFTGTASGSFIDVAVDHWAYEGVRILAEKGIIIGYPDGTFRGHQPLTRYEMATALDRTMRYFTQYLEDMNLLTSEDLRAMVERLRMRLEEHRSIRQQVEELDQMIEENRKALEDIELRVMVLEE